MGVEEQKYAGGPGHLPAGGGQLDRAGDDVVVAAHVVGDGDGDSAAGDEFLIGMSDSGVEFPGSPELDAFHELRAVGGPQAGDGGVAALGVGFAPHVDVAPDDLGGARLGYLGHDGASFPLVGAAHVRMLGAAVAEGSSPIAGEDSPLTRDRIMGGVPAYLSIGDFSRATHMTVKTLRHYHQLGLLEPAEVDPHTGYRRYTAGQIPAAQGIRRFRDLGMPLEEIQGVLSAPAPRTRNERITAPLRRLEEELGRTKSALTSLRDLLAPPSPESAPARIEL